MSDELDDALRSLEKQVNEFTLTMETVPGRTATPAGDDTSATTGTHRPTATTTTGAHRLSPMNTDTSSRHPQLHHYHQGQQSSANTDSDDDDVCVAQLLDAKNRAPRPSRSNTMRAPSASDRSPQPGHPQSSGHHGLQRSASSGGRRQRLNLDAAPPVPAVDRDEEDLRAAMHAAWGFLENSGSSSVGGGGHSQAESKQAAAAVAVAKPSPETALTNESTAASVAPPYPAQKINRSMVKTMTIRIYINDGSTHKTVQLTNLLTTAMVLQYLKKKGLLDATDDWALFEIANSHGLERPLRLWEIVMDAVSTWDMEKNNFLLAKKFTYCNSLVAESVLQKLYPPHYGWLSFEVSKGKWQKRFCFIMENAIYHAKDKQGTGSAILCSLGSFDIYTMLHPYRNAPTEYVFSLRAQEKPQFYERPEDYMKLFAADDAESLRDWVLSIRNAKSTMHYQQYPYRVTNPLAPVDLGPARTGEAPSRAGTLRRHKSTKDFAGALDESGGRSGLSRHSSRRRAGGDGPLIDSTERDPFAKGSLLSDEGNAGNRHHHQTAPVPPASLAAAGGAIASSASTIITTEESGSTLIQLDDKTPFSKGSLLAQTTSGENNNNNNSPSNSIGNKLSRSKSTRETSHHHQSDLEPRRHMSLRRKPTTTSSRGGSEKRRHEVPLPSMPIGSSMPANGPLLTLEDPEQAHSRQLMERQIKPLVNFASSEARPGRR